MSRAVISARGGSDSLAPMPMMPCGWYPKTYFLSAGSSAVLISLRHQPAPVSPIVGPQHHRSDPDTETQRQDLRNGVVAHEPIPVPSLANPLDSPPPAFRRLVNQEYPHQVRHQDRPCQRDRPVYSSQQRTQLAHPFVCPSRGTAPRPAERCEGDRGPRLTAKGRRGRRSEERQCSK